MKERTTKKAIMNAFKYVIEVPYCGLQNVLTGREPNYYTAGIYGWNADIYVIDHETAIVTGYRAFGNIRPEYNTVKKYDDAADRLPGSMTWEARQTARRGILKDMLGDLGLIDDFH